MFNQNSEALQNLIQRYFAGLFYGDVEKLRAVFHPQSFLSGDINGEPYYKSLDAYLEGVKNRKSPHDLGEDNRMELLSLEVLNDVAYARVHVPMFEYNYYDFLALSKVDDQWTIVNKIFTHVAP